MQADRLNTSMATHLPQQRAPQKTEIPDKLYFRIGEVARLCSVAPYVLRFWETEFTQLKPNKSGTGQRLYRRRDVEMALRVKRLLYDEGYTIAGARQAIQAETRSKRGGGQPELPLPQQQQAAQRAEARLHKVRKELREILGMLAAPTPQLQATGAARPHPGRKTWPLRTLRVYAPPRRFLFRIQSGWVAKGLGGSVQSAIGHDAAAIHKAFHCLHGATLSAEVVEVRIAAFRLVPRHKGKTLSRLPFFEAGDIAQNQHPPVVRLQLFPAANVARERDIPNHDSPHLVLRPASFAFPPLCE